MSTFKVERNTGYTVMSNHHLRNKNLSLKAKGLLSQMLSLPDDWDYTLRGLAFINKESIDAIRTAVLELEKAGYITRQQGRDNQGKMSAIEYTIYEYPQEQKPCLENPNTDSEPSLDYPCLENPNTDKPNTEKPTSENPTQLNKDKRKKDILNTDVSITHSFPFIPVSHENRNSRRFEKKRNEMNEINKYRDLIKSNIEYDIMCSRYGANTINELVDLMTETVCTTKDTVRVAGNDYPAELVKSKFLKLDSTHIEFVLDCMRENTSKVKNIRQYLLTVLFNAPSTIESYYSSRVNHDMYGGSYE